MIVELLKTIHFNMETYKQTFDSAMCEILGPFVSKELQPQTEVLEGTSVVLQCEFTLPASMKIHDLREIWSYNFEEIKAKGVSDSANGKPHRVACELKLDNVLSSHRRTYVCILEQQHMETRRSTQLLSTKTVVRRPSGEAAGAEDFSESFSILLYVYLYDTCTSLYVNCSPSMGSALVLLLALCIL